MHDTYFLLLILRFNKLAKYLWIVQVDNERVNWCVFACDQLLDLIYLRLHRVEQMKTDKRRSLSVKTFWKK